MLDMTDLALAGATPNSSFGDPSFFFLIVAARNDGVPPKKIPGRDCVRWPGVQSSPVLKRRFNLTRAKIKRQREKKRFIADYRGTKRTAKLPVHLPAGNVHKLRVMTCARLSAGHRVAHEAQFFVGVI